MMAWLGKVLVLPLARTSRNSISRKIRTGEVECECEWESESECESEWESESESSFGRKSVGIQSDLGLLCKR